MAIAGWLLLVFRNVGEWGEEAAINREEEAHNSSASTQHAQSNNKSQRGNEDIQTTELGQNVMKGGGEQNTTITMESSPPKGTNTLSGNANSNPFEQGYDEQGAY